MVADYIYTNIVEYKISDRAEILTLIKPILSDCIINYRKDAFTDILVWLKHKEQKHSDGSSVTLYELSLDWSDTEFEELMSKYK